MFSHVGLGCKGLPPAWQPKEPLEVGLTPEKLQFHKPNQCWRPGRVMGESPDIHGRLLGGPPASAGPRIISHTYGHPVAGAGVLKGRGRGSSFVTVVLIPTKARGPIVAASFGCCTAR
jgi:hypothetical protein